MAAAWYPCATKTSRAAPRSRPTGGAWGVVGTAFSDPFAGTWPSAPPSTVVVLVDLHFPALLGGIGLVDVERQVNQSLVRARIGILAAGPPLVLSIRRRCFQVA